MKRTIAVGLIVSAVAVLSGAGVVASSHYEEYQNKQTVSAQSVENTKVQSLESQLEAEKAKSAALLQQKQALYAECVRGTQVYAQATTLVKSRTQPISCPQ